MSERDNDHHGTGRLRTTLAIAAVTAVVASMAIVGTVAAQPGQRFPDVPPTHYAYDSIEWAVVNGITQGCGDGRNFCPDETLNRAHMVTFLKRYHDKFGSGSSNGSDGSTDNGDTEVQTVSGRGTRTSRAVTLGSGFYEVEFEIKARIPLGVVTLTAIDEDDDEELIFASSALSVDEHEEVVRLRVGGFGNPEPGRIWFTVEAPASAEWEVKVTAL